MAEKDLYPQEKQRVYLIRESSYLTPYQGTEVTALPATYPFGVRLNVIPEGTEIPIPKIEKKKIYDIDAGKHPSQIANTLQEVVDITLQMDVIFPFFLAYAVGKATGTHIRAEITEITVDYSKCADEDYFLIFGINGSGNVVGYAVIMDVIGNGTSITITGIINVVINFTAPTYTGNDGAINDSVELAKEIAFKLDALAEFTVPVPSTAKLTITNANSGAVPDARDNVSASTESIFIITQQGITNFAITEEISRLLKSFTLHCEQPNPDSNEDIIYDLFGCVVDTYELTIDIDEGIITESVMIKAPHYANGNLITNLPSRWKENIYTWRHGKDTGTNEQLVMEGTTDRTPEIVNKIVLTIKNNAEIKGDYGYQYKRHAISKKRDVSLQLIGSDNKKNLWTLFQDIWNSSDDYYESATGRLNSVLRLEKDSTFDYFLISFYNWLIEEHNAHFFTVDEAIKNYDITFTDGTPDTNKRIINSFNIVSQLSKISMETV